MLQTYQPKKKQDKKEHGFRKRMKTRNGRKVLSPPPRQSRAQLSSLIIRTCRATLWPFFSAGARRAQSGAAGDY
jgi:large subunit ribosomal protein L34